MWKQPLAMFLWVRSAAQIKQFWEAKQLCWQWDINISCASRAFTSVPFWFYELHAATAHQLHSWSASAPMSSAEKDPVHALILWETVPWHELAVERRFVSKNSNPNAHIVMLIFFRNAKGFSVLNLTLQHFNCLDSLDDNIGLLQTLCSF